MTSPGLRHKNTNTNKTKQKRTSGTRSWARPRSRPTFERPPAEGRRPRKWKFFSRSQWRDWQKFALSGLPGWMHSTLTWKRTQKRPLPCGIEGRGGSRRVPERKKSSNLDNWGPQTMEKSVCGGFVWNCITVTSFSPTLVRQKQSGLPAASLSHKYTPMGTRSMRSSTTCNACKYCPSLIMLPQASAKKYG